MITDSQKAQVTIMKILHLYRSGLFLLAMMAVVQAALIKAGDVIEIGVLSHPEFSGRFPVSDNGTMAYPLLGEEVVTRMSTSELQNDLMFRLAKLIDNPMVTILVAQNPEIVVYVLGAVKMPGPVKTYQNSTVQEVLVAAGGVLEWADAEKIKIVRKGETDRSAEYFDLSAFSRDGNIDRIPRLRNGDTVILLASQKSRKVKIIGAVQRPGFFDVPTDSINVFELIYLAGGPAEKADLSRVRRFFKNDGKTLEEIIDVQGYLDKGEMDNMPSIAAGDVIIVYQKWFDWRTVMSILQNTLLFILTIQAFSGVFK